MKRTNNSIHYVIRLCESHSINMSHDNQEDCQTFHSINIINTLFHHCLFKKIFISYFSLLKIKANILSLYNLQILIYILHSICIQEILSCVIFFNSLYLSFSNKSKLPSVPSNKRSRHFFNLPNIGTTILCSKFT